MIEKLRMMQTTCETQKFIKTWQHGKVEINVIKHDVVVRTKWCVIGHVGLKAAS